MSASAVRLLPSRTERTIVSARLLLAASSLFAVWLDPSEPARYVVPTYTLHSLYVVYAVLLTVMTWNRVVNERSILTMHLVDIAVCAVFQYLSLGPSSSPFFMYFAFSLFCGALRWGWRGTLKTGALVIALFMLMGMSFEPLFGGSFDAYRYLTRAFYLVAVAGLLMFLGQHEDRLRGEIERLARWPAASGDPHDVMEQVLAHAAAVVGARHLLVAWEVEDEPWMWVARTAEEGVTVTRHGPGECDVTAAHLHGANVVSAGFDTERVRGQAFFSDLSSLFTELIPLTELVAREIGNSLEQVSINEHLRDVAVSEQRLRVARDLHDGVLQSLTGIRLEVQNVAAEFSAGQARERLHAVERALAFEQRELRSFIDSLKPRVEIRSEDALVRSLDALRERIGLEWKVPVTVRIASPVSALPDAIERAVPPMIHEAVVNALKHGAPSRIWVDIDVHHEALRIVVGDDGHGFPFHGQYDHAALTESQLGPASLRDRAASLGGRLTLESEETGSRLEIQLPLSTEVV